MWMQAAPGGLQANAGSIGGSEQSWMQGYNHLMDQRAIGPDQQRFASFGGLAHLHSLPQASRCWKPSLLDL